MDTLTGEIEPVLLEKIELKKNGKKPEVVANSGSLGVSRFKKKEQNQEY